MIGHILIYIHIHTYIYTYIYIFVCMIKCNLDYVFCLTDNFPFVILMLVGNLNVRWKPTKNDYNLLTSRSLYMSSGKKCLHTYPRPLLKTWGKKWNTLLSPKKGGIKIQVINLSWENEIKGSIDMIKASPHIQLVVSAKCPDICLHTYLFKWTKVFILFC